MKLALLAAHAVAGVAIALLGWNGATSPTVIVLLPVLWVMTPNGSASFGLCLGYFCAATWVLAEGAFVFAGSPTEVFLLVAAWLFQAGVIAGLWTLARAWGRAGARLLLAGIMVQTALLLPPLWLLGIASPVLAWGFVLGGTGWIGLIAGIVLPLSLGLWLRTMQPSARLKGILLLLPVIGLTTYKVDTDLRVSASAYAVQTRWGDSGQSGIDHVLNRFSKVIAAVDVLRRESPQTSTIVLPEAILGMAFANSGVAGEFDLVKPLMTRGVQVLLGADRWVDGHPVESLFVLNADGSQAWVNARQPTPGALWHPWAKDSYATDWWSVPMVKLADGRTALVSFCHEDVMPGFFLSAVARHGRPDVVISVANNWWLKSDHGSNQQAQHALALPRLFGVSIIRSVNRPLLKSSS